MEYRGEGGLPYKRGLVLTVAAIALAISTSAVAGQTEDAPKPRFEHIPERPQAPSGAPNVLLIMTDDVGFAASSTFGGPVPMPNYDALAAAGLRYNNFYTTAMCSPTRAALLTGRNHHRVGFGALSEVSMDEPGYSGIIPDNAATIGKVLKAHGYDTSWFGKNHNTPPWENTPFGPFDRWPLGLGFDYFYGFNGPGTNQFFPSMVENINQIRPSVGNPNYILERDLADHAIQWLDLHESLKPDEPFFLYYAPPTAHGPQQAPKEWIEKFRGKFDMGWDKLREETFRRQKAMGVIPQDAKLTKRPAGIPAWDTLTPEQQRISARMMEVHAAQLAFFDDQYGRVISELKRLGEYDNTLIIYIQGDNGAAEEAGPRGTNNTNASMNNNEPTWGEMAGKIEDFGTPRSAQLFQAGWAFALNAPFPWAKEIASHLGGTRNGMVVSWPKSIAPDAQVRQQFAHVIDVAPTIYEAVGIKDPTEVDGKPQMSLDGTSFAYTFKDAKAPGRHREQYFELLGNRAFYKDGWIASTTPHEPIWTHEPNPVDTAKFPWELYNLNTDFSQAVNLADKYPQKLAELQKGFDEAAKKNNVYPIRGDFFGRLNPKFRPSILDGRTTVTYYPGPNRYPAGSFPVSRTRAWSATAKVVVPQGGADGTLVSQGGWATGWGLFVTHGKPGVIYRTSDHDPEVRLEAQEALAPGSHTVATLFRPDPAPGKGGTVSLLIDGREVASGHAPLSSGFLNQTGTIGILGEEPFDEYQVPFAYTGEISSVTIADESQKK